MKKPLAVCLMILVAFNLFIPMANVEATSNPTTYEDNYYGTIDSSLAIVPNIIINEIGTLKVTITWVTPSLTFEKATRNTPSPSVSYYALKSNQQVVFNIANDSVKSSGSAFDGNIKVTANYAWPTSTLADNNNVSIFLDGEATAINISHGQSNSNIKLRYVANPDFSDPPLSSSLESTDIASLMTANVTFVIEKQ